MRLIDKDAILHDLENGVYPASMTYTLAVDIAKGLIEVASEIDAVPGVRCGECKYAVWEKNEIKYCETWGAKCDCPYEISLAATDYCSYGEKMEGA